MELFKWLSVIITLQEQRGSRVFLRILWINLTIFEQLPGNVVETIRVLLDVWPVLTPPCSDPCSRVGGQAWGYFCVQI
jgi:hypothetical protein